MINVIANHLWQSTMFSGAAALAALALRGHRPQVRYWIWMSASLKFLLPLALLIGLGSRFEMSKFAPTAHKVTTVVQQVGQPFDASAQAIEKSVFTPGATRKSAWRPATLLWAAWLCGVIVVLARWGMRWVSIHRIVQRATPRATAVDTLELCGRRAPAGVRVLSSASMIEPGVFGVFRPVLLLPEGIRQCLTPSQFASILAHEFCHIRRRDNLFSAIQMAVEAIFWFHPLVWWIGARMIAERELACDEEVMGMGNEPRAYAEGILRVCQFYLESPLACAAGVTGADLRKRVTQIMTRHVSRRLTAAGRLLLAFATLTAVATPIAFGFLGGQPQPAQPTFDVASVKPAGASTTPTTLRLLPGGGFQGENVSFLALVLYAYRLQSYQVTGTSGWMTSDKFEVLGKPPAGSDTTALKDLSDNQRQRYADLARTRLQALLAERFHLVVQHETRESSGYALVVAKSGNKLTVNPMPGGGQMRTVQGEINGNGSTIAMLTGSLSALLRQMVVDKTNLSGQYDFHLKWTPDPSPGMPADGNASPSDGPSIFTAVQEQLGLKLESQKVPIDMLVIQGAEKPSAN